MNRKNNKHRVHFLKKYLFYWIYKTSNYFIPDLIFFEFQHFIFHKKYGEKAYLANLKNPNTFNEKILWLKLHDRSPLSVLVSDKLQVRNYIKEKIGEKYLVPLIGIYNNVDEINFETLPRSFVMKTNHASGFNVICKDKNEIDVTALFSRLKFWMKLNYYYYEREWQYRNIKPKILCEKYLEGEELLGLPDYKIFCFKGEPKYIQVDMNRFEKHSRNFYDVNWNQLPFTVRWPLYEGEIKAPKKLDELLHLARKLSDKFIFCRIDLYINKEQVLFGEITIHPGGGYNTFVPFEYDQIIGQHLTLP